MRLFVNGRDLLQCFAEQRDDAVFVPGRPEQGRTNLRRWVARFCEARGWDGALFFDDTAADEVRPLSERAGRVRVVNMPYAKEAWLEMAGQANRSAMREETLVVTDDIRLIRALERGKAKVVTPAQFVARAREAMGRSDEDLTEEPDEKFSGLSEEEVDVWMDFFRRDE
jgi:hypothetical protein